MREIPIPDMEASTEPSAATSYASRSKAALRRSSSFATASNLAARGCFQNACIHDFPIAIFHQLPSEFWSSGLGGNIGDGGGSDNNMQLSIGDLQQLSRSHLSLPVSVVQGGGDGDEDGPRPGSPTLLDAQLVDVRIGSRSPPVPGSITQAPPGITRGGPSSHGGGGTGSHQFPYTSNPSKVGKNRGGMGGSGGSGGGHRKPKAK